MPLNVNASFIAIIGCRAVPAAVDHFVPALAHNRSAMAQYGVLAVGLAIGTGVCLALRTAINRAFGVQ
ncbi:hypothetical protein DIE18_02330 [Burkholderia sp. Bp9125]|nr:hypothetical protein DIE18_02330 [Burkholderia sp. Bp9125]